jgi:hypothetical protein
MPRTGQDLKAMPGVAFRFGPECGAYLGLADVSVTGGKEQKRKAGE